MSELFDFAWEVATSGHQIVKGKNGRMLTDLRQLGRSYEVIKYLPLKQYTGLFRMFADLETTEAAVVAFADRYGLLSNDVAYVETIPVQKDGHAHACAEPIEKWFEQIDRMKRAVSLWDIADERDNASLQKIIKWVGDDRVIYELKQGGMDIPNAGFKRGDLIQPAKGAVQKIVNRELSDRVAPRLLWEETRPRLALYIVPLDLLGALWLQFASAINGDTKHRRCETCRTWFAILPRFNRVDKKHCSDACRTRAYRDRKESKKRGSSTKKKRA